MKIIMISFILVLLAPSSHFVLGNDEAVLDWLKRPVKANTTYAITDSTGGFISPHIFSENPCPRAVASTYSTIYRKWPMFVSSSDVITLTTKFNIKFSVDPCNGTGLWNVALNKTVFVNGTTGSSVESIFSFVKTNSSEFSPTYNIVSGNGIIGLRAIPGPGSLKKLLVLEKSSSQPLSVTLYRMYLSGGPKKIRPSVYKF